MSASFPAQSPPVLCFLAVLVFLAMLISREASVTEDLPIFLPNAEKSIYVEVVAEGMASGVYQFSDDLAPRSVIQLTEGSSSGGFELNSSAWSLPLQQGERLVVVKKDRKIAELGRSWMSASHRMALNIPLHPDRMSLQDWLALPGVGPVLAERIEMDRQKNGDFGNLKSLTRVKGVGAKRIDSWKMFFEGV